MVSKRRALIAPDFPRRSEIIWKCVHADNTENEYLGLPVTRLLLTVFVSVCVCGFTLNVLAADDVQKQHAAETITTTSEPNAIAGYKSETDRLENQLQQCKSIISTLNKSLSQCARSSVGVSPELQKAYVAAKKVEYKSQARLHEHRASIFEWQLMAANVVLALVVLVVSAGIIFSAMQLRKALLMDQPQDSAELELSATKIRVTSSVVGIIVLVLSLGFLYLFLTEVFDLEPIDLTAPEQGQAEKPKT